MAYSNNRKDNKREEAQSEYIEKVVYLNRVSKTVKGGRIYKFAALVVIGDGKGKVGYGLGKAGEVSEAIRRVSRMPRRIFRQLPSWEPPFPTRLSVSSAPAEFCSSPLPQVPA